MCPEELAMLEEIQALEFTVIELQLFLDTHPADERALADYNAAAQQLACLKNAYAQRFGPLTAQEPGAAGPAWLCGLWPWEIDYTGR